MGSNTRKIDLQNLTDSAAENALQGLEVGPQIKGGAHIPVGKSVAMALPVSGVPKMAGSAGDPGI